MKVKLYISMQGLLAKRRCCCGSACFGVLEILSENNVKAQHNSRCSPARVPSGRALPQTGSRIRKPEKENTSLNLSRELHSHLIRRVRDGARQNQRVQPAGSHWDLEHLGQVLIRQWLLNNPIMKLPKRKGSLIEKSLTSPRVDLAWFSSCLF